MSPQERNAREAVDDVMQKNAQKQQQIALGCGKNPGDYSNPDSTPRVILGKKQDPDISGLVDNQSQGRDPRG